MNSQMTGFGATREKLGWCHFQRSWEAKLMDIIYEVFGIVCLTHIQLQGLSFIHIF